MTLAIDLVFYLFASVLVFSAFMVIVVKNPVHAVLWLITAFINGAGLFLVLGAEFLAMILVIVYAGAVAILFLFVVMMLDLHFLGEKPGLRRSPMGFAVGGILLLDIIVMVSGWETSPQAESLIQSPTPDAASVSNAVALGQILYTDYIYLFQAAGLVLLVAMIGAILLTFRREPGHHRQKVADQLARQKEETLKMNKVESGKGIQ